MKTAFPFTSTLALEKRQIRMGIKKKHKKKWINRYVIAVVKNPDINIPVYNDKWL